MPFNPVAFVEVLAVSAAGGFVGAILGLGGGVVVIPLLTSGFGYSIRSVIGASLISVIATSSGAAAAYVKDHLTNIRIAMFLETATASGAILGAKLSGLMAPRVLYALFSVALLGSAVGMFQRRHQEGAAKVAESPWARRLRLEGTYRVEEQGTAHAYRAGRLLPGFAVMLGAGAVSGVLGIGSGLFKVLAMDMIMGLPIKVSSATSNFMIGVTAAAGAGIHLARGDVDPAVAAPVALGVLLGAWAGSKLLPRMRGRTVRYLFVPVLVYMALQMAWKGFWG